MPSQENTPGSDTRIRLTGESMSGWLTGRDVVMSCLRERQWEHMTPAGLVWIAPPCFDHDALSWDAA